MAQLYNRFYIYLTTQSPTPSDGGHFQETLSESMGFNLGCLAMI